VASAGLRRLGWAASIALAIGAGWLLREGQLRQVAQAGVAPSVAVETEAESDAPLLAEGVGPGATTDDNRAEAAGNPVSPEGEADGGRRMPSIDQATPRVALASSTVGVADGFGPDDAGDGRWTVLLEELDAPAALTAATDAARPLAAGPVERLSVVSVPSASETLRSVEPSGSSRDRSGPLVPVASASAVDRGGMARRRELSDDDLPRDKAVALAVPGYDVRSIVNLGGGTTSLGVHVQQSLDHSVTFDVYHLEAGVAPEVLEPAPAGVAEVRVESEEGWVVIRGELDDATLSELLARLFSE
jgi:hypothetical protein